MTIHQPGSQFVHFSSDTHCPRNPWESLLAHLPWKLRNSEGQPSKTRPNSKSASIFLTFPFHPSCQVVVLRRFCHCLWGTDLPSAPTSFPSSRKRWRPGRSVFWIGFILDSWNHRIRFYTLYICNHMCIYIYVGMYVCMYVRTYVCMYAWMYVCTHVCVYMYVCMYVYITRAHVCEACFLPKKRSFFWNCLIVLLLRLPAQQCTQPQSSTYGGHECEEDVRCHGGVPESTMSFVVGYNPRSHLKESS